MKVKITQFHVDMEIRSKGVELEVRKPDGSRLGDLWVTKSKLIWCKGQTQKRNGKEISWARFVEYMESL